MSEGLPVPRLVPVEVERLEQQARALARGEEAADEAAAGLLRLVAFQLGGAPCAVEARVVVRAVAGLARPLGVPIGTGEERAVIFVDEVPLPVADLAGHAAGARRMAVALERSPALVVTTPAGPVAVAVDGPLDLTEDRLGAVQPEQDGEGVRLSGRLAGGASLVDADWLAGWAEKAIRA